MWGALSPLFAILWGDALMSEKERELRNRFHMQMGITAAVLGLAAAGVGLWWISSSFGVSPWAALAEAMPLFGIVLLILGAGALFSLATVRLAARAGRRKEPTNTGE